MADTECIFCKLPATAVLVRNDLALAFFDKFPVNEGHVLIIPKRHAASFFDLTEEEVLSSCRTERFSCAHSCYSPL